MGKRSSHRKKEEDSVIKIENEEFDETRRQRKVLNYNFTLKHIRPLTENQGKVFHSYFSGQNILVYGFAGTGKSFISLYLALNDLFNGRYKKIIICRTLFQLREIGFTPGSVEEKMSLYELPYKQICAELCGRENVYNFLKEKGVIEFTCTSFLRGQTFDDALIIIEEAQNFSMHELDSIITRAGKNSKIIITGDLLQNDLENNRKKEKSGFADCIEVCQKMKSFDLIHFEISDVCRSGIAKEWLLTKYNLGK